MLYEIFKFELNYRSKRADTYIYFFVLFLYSIIAVDFIYEGTLEGVKRNAPYVIARTMGIVSALFMIITSMIMGVAALRDFDHQMESLMFVNPISKKDYLFGRFLGSFFILFIVFLAVPIGMIIGDLMPWHDPEILLSFNLKSYIQPFFTLVLPTLFFGAAIFFVSGALSRKLIVVYTQGILFLMLYLLLIQIGRGLETQSLVSLFDPFTFQAIALEAKYWTVTQKNNMPIPLNGTLFLNRIIWVIIGVIALCIGYVRFKFRVLLEGKRKDALAIKRKSRLIHSAKSDNLPKLSLRYNGLQSLKTILKQSFFYFKSILKEVSFWAIVICAISIILVSSINLGTSFGVDSYPTTYIIIGELLENTAIFFLLIIIFYSGELIWKERDQKLENIVDTLPISDFTILVSKFFGLVLTFSTLILAMIAAGILFQTSKGYYKYELNLYFTGFFIEIAPFLVLLAIACFFFQVLINHKYIAHLVTVIVVLGITIPLRIKGIDHGLYTFGGSDLGGYSDMNGYGHFLRPYLWFKTYWMAFGALLFIIATVLSVRGVEASVRKRLRQIKSRISKPMLQWSLVLVAIFVSSGCYIFYNTNVLNNYSFTSEENSYRAAYEQKLKRFEYLPQPKIVDVNLKLELFPSERGYTAEGFFVLKNSDKKPISEIHIQKVPSPDVRLEYLNFDGLLKTDSTYNEFGYYIYTLHHPLAVGDSLRMNFKQVYESKGFVEYADNNIVENGTFFTNFHFPTIGYMNDIEIEDDDVRNKFDLAPQLGRLEIDDPRGLVVGRNAGDGEEINFEMVIGTDADQIAITSGTLIKEWKQNDRNYYHYKAEKPMSHFYSMLSARYEVMTDQWFSSEEDTNPVDLEIYYHKGHEYNLDRMMHGMKKSLSYFGSNFGPYQYSQMRIVEVPNYRKRAQSFPNTVPFSENVGFILDIQEDDVDMAFYVTAHEVAHQWWGHQVNPANVKGKFMLAETLAQYSAVMVLKEQYSEEKLKQFLAAEKEDYLRGRTLEEQQEPPLVAVDDQEYIYYRKGAVAMYAFQDYISEDSVNSALKRYVRDWNSFEDTGKNRYSTTSDLLPYFRAVTPDSLQYVVSDLFEKVTLYDNEVTQVEVTALDDGKYRIKADVGMRKLNGDMTPQTFSNEYVDIGVFDESGETLCLEKHKVAANSNEIIIDVSGMPARVAVDPNHILIDIDNENNHFKM